MSGVDPALLRRFESVRSRIAWRPAPKAAGPGDRIAHLHDEEARILLEERRGAVVLTTDPGPLGALVVLLELPARGPPDRLEAIDRAGAPFAAGAFRAGWGTVAPVPGARSIPLEDLVGVARYALA